MAKPPRLSVACCFLLSAVAQGATLQISPAMVELQPGVGAVGVTLSNPGTVPLYGQVRVFRWQQENGEDVLTTTQDLVASPPLIQIGAHAEQLVRLVRTDRTAVTAEQGYRVVIDELPQPDSAASGSVMIRLRYSIPVFVEPGDGAMTVGLSWRLVRNPQGWALRVDNAGRRRAQLAGVTLETAGGQSVAVSPGLLGYALAGRWRSWQVTLPQGLDLHGPVKARAAVNSQKTDSVVTVD